MPYLKSIKSQIMKKVFLLTAALIVVAMSFSTESMAVVSSTKSIESIKATPPAAVMNSFVSIFGNVPVRQWKLRSDGNWRAHFLRNGIAWEATFTAAGVLVKSERDRK